MLRYFPLYTALMLATSCGPRPSQPTVPAASTTDVASAADQRAIAAAYTERLRLGLGSPFRLMETALLDPRLGEHRSPVARALLTQLADGRAYEIDARALVAAGAPDANALAQTELIRRAIESAPDPRIGELAVNLAYRQAVLERAVAEEIANRVARMAALLRDRSLAMRDVQRLRAEARRLAVAPENLVMSWRRDRAFAVEQPTLAPVGAAAREEAARLATLLVGGIRVAAAPVTAGVNRSVPDFATGLDAANALIVTTDTATRVPHSAIAITLRMIRAGATDPRARVSAPHWRPIFEDVSDEESFVAHLGLARRSPADDIVAASIALDVATALRPFAQDRISRQQLTVQDFTRRFGVRVKFHAGLSPAERNRMLVMLESTLLDLRSVVRSIDLNGLTFEIGPMAPSASHLAYHDPRRRIIRLDPATAAGTLAHEIAHDLDWQLATRKYKTRVNYATDYAAKRGKALAHVVESLTQTAEMNESADARRPAEIFARRFDWYVANALALAGRSNGYLSSVQSDFIPGYGGAVRPDPAAAKSFAAILAEAAVMDRTQLAEVERVVVASAPAPARGPCASAFFIARDACTGTPIASIFRL